MGLSSYHKKRKFNQTPEPSGQNTRKFGKPTAKQNIGHSPKLAFVVQEHHASTPHYDFRLELDGVLKSWAVPKGPSLDPHEHHLAIQTEDHPYEYRKFEGVIPEGNYGAGNVIIWDNGWYEARKGDPKDSQKTLRAELKKGHLTFTLHGQKLKGEFALIKMSNAKENNAWLLVKKGDEFASTSDVTKQAESIVSQKHVDDLGAHGKLPDLPKYPKKTAPWTIKPMLCTPVKEPFKQEGWLFEIKWDGYRALASKHKEKYQLYSRNGNNFLDNYPPVAEALRAFKHDVIVDGEIVVVDEQGAAHFEWLQNWRHEKLGNLQYYIFDILWCDGHDVRAMPLLQRKALLKSVLPNHPVLKFSDHVETDGVGLFDKIRQRGLEGIVAKKMDSFYSENDRGDDWLKIKAGMRQEVVIGGYTEPRGGRKYLGSLLIGVYEKGKLRYAGHSGGGIADAQRKTLQAQLAKLERQTSPFDSQTLTTEHQRNYETPVHWVEPKLICEMSFTEWTSEGHLRHPQFKGMRADKKPTEIYREKPQNQKHIKTTTPSKTISLAVGKNSLSGKAEMGSQPGLTNGLPFEPTHLDKVFFPKLKYTKGDLFKYYESVAEYILPYLKDRPISLNRMPNGISGESFFQKNNEHLPPWVPAADIFSESNNADLHWIVGGELNTLLYLVQLGCIEINPWSSRLGHLERPDWVVIDLDPEGVGFPEVIKIAHTVHEVCEEWGIACYPKTSGKSGLHVYIPMQAKYTYEQGKNLAHLIVLEVNKRRPEITSVERNPEKRKHKIYLDFLQNRESQTLAAPYSVRPTPDATVSMPLHWDEIKSGLSPTDFTIGNALIRLKRTGDLWQPVLAKAIDLTKILKKLEIN